VELRAGVGVRAGGIEDQRRLFDLFRRRVAARQRSIETREPSTVSASSLR
jgi:hypothetical protein